MGIKVACCRCEALQFCAGETLLGLDQVFEVQWTVLRLEDFRASCGHRRVDSSQLNGPNIQTLTVHDHI